MTVHSPESTTASATPADARARLLRYAFMKLTRDLDSRFEALLLTGRVSKWYSEVGSEATTIPAGLALGAGDALCTLHRDLGAILAVYLDPARAFPGLGFGRARMAGAPSPTTCCTASPASSSARPKGSRRASSARSTTATWRPSTASSTSA